MIDTTLNQLSDIIQNRRSIGPRLFSDNLIPDEQVAQLLENALWAPNHRKTEPWRFYVYTKESKAPLADFFQKTYTKHFQGTEKYSEKKRGDIRKKVEKSSHVIAICMQRDPDERVPEWEEIAAVACAVQNFWLSVSAAGLGGYWSSPGYLMNAFPTFKDLQNGERCLGFFYLGEPKSGIELKSQRQKEGKITWV